MEAAIIGATGYTGFELVKILLRHSKIKIKYVTSDTSAGKNTAILFPYLRGLF